VRRAVWKTRLITFGGAALIASSLSRLGGSANAAHSLENYLIMLSGAPFNPISCSFRTSCDVDSACHNCLLAFVLFTNLPTSGENFGQHLIQICHFLECHAQAARG
jgi:hypothetical protein